jgi:Ca2+-binding RTX toxin-like protein
VLEEVVIFLTTSKVVDTLPPALVAIVGTDGSDYPQGGSSNDVIFGLAGNDLIYGGSGNDTLTGGSSSDIFTFTTLVLTELI